MALSSLRAPWSAFMKILLFHPVSLPPRDYGGVERVVQWLSKGLVELGHEVWIAALEGSSLPAGVRLLEISRNERSALGNLERFPSGIDVVHFMAPPEKEIWTQLPCSGVLTVHGNGQIGEEFPLNSVFVSQNHAIRHGATAYVHNGIDPAEYLFDPALKENWYLFLSKTSWRVKNLSGAMRFCQRARVPLRIAGGRRPWYLRAKAFFDPHMHWVGTVAGEKKARLLAQAKALVFPVTWPEPFGLVVAEALMSGTPVLAADQGSLKELISPEVGGTLSLSDPRWMEWLVKSPLPWNSEDCRRHAMEKFHYQVMARRYVEIYQRVQSGESLNQKPPRSQGEGLHPVEEKDDRTL